MTSSRGRPIGGEPVPADRRRERTQSVSRLCRTLGATRSGYYDWQRQPLSDRKLADWLLTEQIRQVFAESVQTYGSPRVFKELTLGRGVRIGEKRVARLMRQAGLVAVSSRRRKHSTTRSKEYPLAPDLVQRDFSVDGPDRLWVADFTQLTTWQGTAYIAVVADAYSRLCLGWAVRDNKTVELVLEALDMAIWRRGQMPPAPFITRIKAPNTPPSPSPAAWRAWEPSATRSTTRCARA